MGTGLKYTGIGLILVGILFGIFSLIMFAGVYSVSLDNKQMDLMDNTDFTQTDTNEFTGRFNEKDSGVDIIISVDSKTGYEFMVKASILKQYDNELDTYTEMTPYEEEFDLETLYTGYYNIVITPLEGNHTLNDLTITVTTDDDSGMNEFMALCCGTTILGPLGVLMVIVGIILLIVNAVQGLRKDDPPPQPQVNNYYTSPPQYQQQQAYQQPYPPQGNYPPQTPPQQSGYTQQRQPPQGGYPQQRPQTAPPPPRAAPPPPGHDDRGQY